MAELIEIKVVTRGAGRAARDIKGIGDSGRRAAGGVDLLKGALATLGVGRAARELIQLADASTRIDNRLNLLTGSQRATNAVFGDLVTVARRTRSELESTVDLYSRLQRSTQDVGLSTQALIDLTAGVNEAFKIYGNTAAEAEAATIQFSQGLAAGALRGDELRSVLEQAPRLAIAIAEGLTEIEALGPGIRVGIGDLRDLGREGVLTAEAVTEALSTQLGTLREEFEQTTPTIQDAFTLLQNEALVAFRALTDGTDITKDVANAIIQLGQAIRPTIDFLIEFVGLFVETFNILKLIATSVLGDTIAGFVALTAAIGLLNVAIGLNPLVLFSVGAVAAVAAIRELADGTTVLTDSIRDTISSIEDERDAIEIITALLERNGIVTVEQAKAKLAEAQARRLNIITLRDEANAQIALATAELKAQLARSQVLNANKLPGFNIPIVQNVADIANISENLELIELAGQANNGLEALRQLQATAAGLQGDFEGNEEVIKRINALLEEGVLTSTQASKGQREARDEAEKEAQRIAEAAERLAGRQARNFGIIATQLSLVSLEAGNGAEALREIEQIQGRITNSQTRGTITEQQARTVAAEGEAKAILAQSVAVQDLIDNLGKQTAELKLSNDELEVRNMLEEIGLSIDAVSPEQLASLREKQALITQTNAAKERELELDEFRADVLANLGNGQELSRLAQEAAILQEVISNEGGLFNTAQIADAQRGLEDIAETLREIRLEAGEGSFFDGFLGGIQEFADAGGQALQEFGGSVAGVTEQLAGGFADAIASAIVDGEDLGEALKGVAREAIKELISSLVQLGIQFLLNQAISATLGAAAVGIASAQAGALASAWAPAAALASLASFGANALPAAAALAATTGLASALSSVGAVGLKDGGMVTGPGGPRDDRVPAMLSNGEFVVNAAATRDNRGILEAINNGNAANAANSAARRVTVNMNVTTNDADSFRRNSKQINRDLQAGLNRT